MTNEKFQFLVGILGMARAKQLREEARRRGKDWETVALAMGLKEGLEAAGKDEEKMEEVLGDFRVALDSEDPVDGYLDDLREGKVVGRFTGGLE